MSIYEISSNPPAGDFEMTAMEEHPNQPSWLNDCRSATTDYDLKSLQEQLIETEVYKMKKSLKQAKKVFKNKAIFGTFIFFVICLSIAVCFVFFGANHHGKLTVQHSNVTAYGRVTGITVFNDTIYADLYSIQTGFFTISSFSPAPFRSLVEGTVYDLPPKLSIEDCEKMIGVDNVICCSNKLHHTCLLHSGANLSFTGYLTLIPRGSEVFYMQQQTPSDFPIIYSSNKTEVLDIKDYSSHPHLYIMEAKMTSQYELSILYHTTVNSNQYMVCSYRIWDKEVTEQCSKRSTIEGEIAGFWKSKNSLWILTTHPMSQLISLYDFPSLSLTAVSPELQSIDEVVGVAWGNNLFLFHSEFQNKKESIIHRRQFKW